MASAFHIPNEAIEYLRGVFSHANDEVSRLLVMQPSMHEEGLDFALIGAIQRSGSRILPRSKVVVQMEAHWLGGRAMFRRWEIADIALVVMLRNRGNLIARKVALLQSKRLYSSEIPVSELEEADYVIGIGRFVDRVDPTVPLSRPRAFSFTPNSLYGQLNPKGGQITRIDEYATEQNIPVYYALYNPINVPFKAKFPWAVGGAPRGQNRLGCRIMERVEVHSVLRGGITSPPKFHELAGNRKLGNAPFGKHGWRLENFVADELLKCRQGRLFDEKSSPDLQVLLYERSAPIAAAIAVTVDVPE